MRSDPRLLSALAYLGICLFNFYALILYAQGDLVLYIHPRYVLFTVVLNALSLAACIVGFGLVSWRMRDRMRERFLEVRVPWRPSVTLVAAALVVAAAYALPARTLSSQVANQRSGNLNVPQGPVSGATDTLALFSADTTQLTIADWISVFDLKPDADFYEEKRADVVGFVYQPEGAPPDVFYVSRFRVICCAVDAQPLGMPVRLPGWRERFRPDSWVRVTGGFAPSGGSVAEPVVVVPQDVERTEQPEDPYVVG